MSKRIALEGGSKRVEVEGDYIYETITKPYSIQTKDGGILFGEDCITRIYKRPSLTLGSEAEGEARKKELRDNKAKEWRSRLELSLLNFLLLPYVFYPLLYILLFFIFRFFIRIMT